jgi:hypothetical protein
LRDRCLSREHCPEGCNRFQFAFVYERFSARHELFEKRCRQRSGAKHRVIHDLAEECAIGADAAYFVFEKRSPQSRNCRLTR